MSLFNKMFGKKNNQPTVDSTEESNPSQQAGASKVDVNKPVENPKLKELFEQWRQEKTDVLLNQVFEEIVIRAHFLSVIMLSEEPEVLRPLSRALLFSFLCSQHRMRSNSTLHLLIGVSLLSGKA